MTCEYCGAALPADSRFCKKCGATVGEPGVTRGGSPAADQMKDQDSPPGKADSGMHSSSEEAEHESSLEGDTVLEEEEELEDLLKKPPDRGSFEGLHQGHHHHHHMRLKRVKRHRSRLSRLLGKRKDPDARKSLFWLAAAIIVALIIAYMLLGYLDRRSSDAQLMDEHMTVAQTWAYFVAVVHAPIDRGSRDALVLGASRMSNGSGIHQD